MKILVTGGAGFIGSHLVDLVVQKGHQVCLVDNLSTGLKENLNSEAKFYEIDIRNKKLLEVFEKEKPEVVFHLAGQINLRKSIEDPVFDTKVNILGSLNVLECCRKFGVKKFIFSSTGGAIYGGPASGRSDLLNLLEGSDPFKHKPCRRFWRVRPFCSDSGGSDLLIPTPETAVPQPTSPYGLAKLTVEKYLEIYRQIYGLDYVALRYANVYGPRQNTKAEAGVVAIFIENLLQGKPCIINGDGRQTRDYIYVDDVVRANLLALSENRDSPHSGTVPIFNVGTGAEISVNQIFERIAGILGRSDPPKSEQKGPTPQNNQLSIINNHFGSDPSRKLKGSNFFKYGPAIKGELQRSALDWQKIKKDFGWRPEINLDKGLRMTINWFRKN